MEKSWNIINNNIQTEKSVIERLLDIRGITTEKRKQDFLNPLKMNFTSPYAFLDMKKSVERICKAIENNEKIVIWGDFDADGVTSTCLMYKTLQFLGANIDYYIPSRQTESHGLNSPAIIKFLTQKTKLFITVDCASNDEKEISLIKSFGADIIVTDHHETDKKIPQIYGLINPKANDNLDESLSFDEIEYLTNLAGVGVAFKLALALLEKFDKKAFSKELLPLVTLGTIADIVPLIGENRAFVMLGLDLIKQGQNKGITALLKSINYNYEINSECIAFYIAPRINASGRVDTAQISFNLLCETDDEKLTQYCEQLNQYNIERQELCDEIYEEAVNVIANDEKFNEQSAIVLYKSDWNVGIIGIVASKLVETFYKPAFLMCDKGELITCSSRGIDETDIHLIISNISDYLENGGGHKMAGGFAFNPKKTSFDCIKEQINETVSEMVGERELTPHINIDMELSEEHITLDFVEELKILEPYGTQNPVPVFCVENAQIISAKLMGQKQNHLKLQCCLKDNIFDCVFWNKDNIPKAKNNLINLAFALKENEFNGVKKVQIDLKDMQYEKDNPITFIDARNKENICELLEDYCKNNADKIKIYAYKKDTLEKLKSFKNLYENILTKDAKIINTPQLVFLDYPKTLENLRIIIDKLQPEIVHFAKSYIKLFEIEDYLKTLCGLLKFILNKKEGKINYFDISNYFNYDEKFIKESVKFLSELNIITMTNSTIIAINPVEISKLKEHAEFKTLKNYLQINNDFLQKLMNLPIKELETII